MVRNVKARQDHGPAGHYVVVVLRVSPDEERKHRALNVLLVLWH